MLAVCFPLFTGFLTSSPKLTLQCCVSAEHPQVEEACVEMLLQLAPLKPPTVFNVIHAWYTSRQNPVPRHLKDRIISLRNLIKSRVPHMSLDQFS